MANRLADQHGRSEPGDSRPRISPEYSRKSRPRCKTRFSCRRRLARDIPSHSSNGKGLALPVVSVLRRPKLLDRRAFLYRLGSRAFACAGGQLRSTQKEWISSLTKQASGLRQRLSLSREACSHE